MTMRTRGLFAYFGYELPLAQRLALIARAGFAGTAMWWADDEALVRAGRRAEMPAMVRDAGLAPLNAHLSFADCNDIWSPSRTVRESWLARRAADVEECARLDVPCAILHVTHGVDAPEPTGDGLDVLGRLVRQAEQAGVTLAVENTRRDDIVHRVLETFDSPAVGFCYDSSHDWMWGRPRGGTLRRWGARLVQTHLADCDAEGRDRHLLPGDGPLDWREVAGLFPPAYRGPLMLEVLPRDLGRWASPEAFLAEAKRRLERLEGLLPEAGG